MTMDKTPKKELFFKKMEQLGLALTYDDVRLKSGFADMMPHEVSIRSSFSRNVPLNVPIVSAGMDTVTEHKMATKMAKMGGLGVIHRNFTPALQASEVGRVKSHLNALIEEPTCVYEDETIEEILTRRDSEELPFHSFPVLNREGRLVGILTKNDFDFCDQPATTVKDAMSREVITASFGTSIEDAYEIMRTKKKKVLPLVDEQGCVSGLYIFSDVLLVQSGKSLDYNLDPKGQLRVAAAIGTGPDSFERTKRLIDAKVDVLVIDTAHGDSRPVVEMVKHIKREYPSIDVVAGNISEPESAHRLLKAGVDGIKVGQGPGSICTTRIIAGIGSPQVSAVYQCARLAKEMNVPICADGGLRYSGDITIAIGAGAGSVMMGSMLAGTEESPGRKVFLNGRQWKYYRGMGSLSAMMSSRSSRERYRQNDDLLEKLIPEGVEGMVPFKGNLEDVLFQYIGGLRSGMGYVGASTISDLQHKADFHRISSAGKAESHPHDIQITKESPNYSGSRGE